MHDRILRGLVQRLRSKRKGTSVWIVKAISDFQLGNNCHFWQIFLGTVRKESGCNYPKKEQREHLRFLRKSSRQQVRHVAWQLSDKNCEVSQLLEPEFTINGTCSLNCFFFSWTFQWLHALTNHLNRVGAFSRAFDAISLLCFWLVHF